MAKTFKIATLAGDGIGLEVLPEGIKVVKAVAEKYDIDIQLDAFDWASCDYYLEHGQMMPDHWFETLQQYDAIFFGAAGWPDKVPDHISLWGSLLQFRRRFDQYVNLRPVRLMPGVKSPLADKQPGDIDFYVVRENSEGEYSAIGGKAFEGTDREFVLQEAVFTRHGVDRILKYAFEFAKERDAKKLTAATKSNGIAVSMPYWDERVDAMSAKYPEVKADKQHVDILAARFVLQPERFDVVVASNLFGDILSDLGPACTGTIGLAASANLNPERKFPSLFEPVHGSAPDIYGQNIANPIAAIWSGAMMLEFLGSDEPKCIEASQEIMNAIEHVLINGPKTADVGGTAKTYEVGDAIAELIRRK
ncbi:tartrate dehydrogenase [Acinetobacter sp. ANC 4558]|nr:tartrate dehydrogenase [Acinetobacter sp. ANC 4558]